MSEEKHYSDDPEVDAACKQIAADMERKVKNLLLDAPRMTGEEAEDAAAKFIAKGIRSVLDSERKPPGA